MLKLTYGEFLGKTFTDDTFLIKLGEDVFETAVILFLI
jgi:hypothetical protein